MGSAHLYFPGDRLSAAELTAACLDGHLVAVGDAYIPADAVETAALRAGSIAPLLGDGLAATGLSAAWIHGGIDEPPARHRVQRVGTRRLHHVIDRRLEYHDTPIPEADLTRVGGVRVATPARTVGDLLRPGGAHDIQIARRLIDSRTVTAAAALAALDDTGPLPGKRLARRLLQEWIASAGQLDVTR
ncbi:hypothetical protein [Microbacterium sp. KR10-403]|uniref:hypothetical protein n=1 Tax=Microbacterium sp. KR10-403 TaxID=3158581 RepID=UPI0032E3DECB